MNEDERTRHDAERAARGLAPLPLGPDEVERLIAAIRAAAGPAPDLVDHLARRVPPGVDDAARVKAAFLGSIALGEHTCAAIDAPTAIRLLGTMRGGYNVAPLVELLGRPALGALAARQLGSTLLVFDAFHDIAARAAAGNRDAQSVLQSWAAATWLQDRAPVPEELRLTVFRVAGEITTDDLSPAREAWSRADVPLHAQSFLEARTDVVDPIPTIASLRSRGLPVAFVGDVVGTGSSRKSATNSLLWLIGDDVPFVPGKRRGGVVLGGSIAPIFCDTLRDAGALPVECDVSSLATGDAIALRPRDGRITTASGETIVEFPPIGDRRLDEVRAGGRVLLMAGRALAERARIALGRSDTVIVDGAPSTPGGSRPPAFTLAQKIVGRACGRAGVAAGESCEPVVSSVGSQDTTGPMNRSELEELACLGFAADLVLQTFCHTAAYPRFVDVETQRTLPPFMQARGAVVLRPGDGIIHSWINRMLLPDQVGTGSDSHTRFPLGISFPAGSGLVAFAAAMGFMPLDMPESVLVRFRGARRPGITVRDAVHAIPFVARHAGLLTLDPTTKRNVFAGRIIEIAGLEELSVEEAFELTDATAERSAAAATIALSEDVVAAHLRAGVALLHDLIDAGYEDAGALARRAAAMESWLASPTLLHADAGATYAATVEIDLDAITEPLVACPNDPDDVRPLSAVAGREVDEVFVGSCMTRLDHFRAAAAVLEGAEAVASRVWIAPPTRMVEAALRSEGSYSTFAVAGARTEIPGCSLCMGNQARVAPGATVVSTSTRNYPNRMGRGAQVFLASAEVAALAGRTGRLPSPAEYFAHVGGG